MPPNETPKNRIQTRAPSQLLKKFFSSSYLFLVLCFDFSGFCALFCVFCVFCVLFSFCLPTLRCKEWETAEFAPELGASNLMFIGGQGHGSYSIHQWALQFTTSIVTAPGQFQFLVSIFSSQQLLFMAVPLGHFPSVTHGLGLLCDCFHIRKHWVDDLRKHWESQRPGPWGLQRFFGSLITTFAALRCLLPKVW